MINNILKSLTSIQEYRYSSFDNSATEIRLLTIAPGSFSDHIQCSLEHHQLVSNPEYEALSYCWGRSKDVRRITLNGRRSKVTTSLDTALRYLRLENQKRTLWVDALCINQSDDHEKAEQVKLMFRIYSSAKRVLAWTGEADGDSDAALALIFKINALMPEETSWDKIRMSPQILHEMGLEPSTTNWLSLWHFMSRPYWTRLWMVQELVAGGEIFATRDPDPYRDGRCMVGCGNTWFNRNVLTATFMFVFLMNRFVHNFTTFDGQSKTLEEPHLSAIKVLKDGQLQLPMTAMFSTLNALLSHAHQPRKTRLADVLYMTTDFQVTEPRDRVFAVIGLCGEDYGAFPVDYHFSVRALHEVATRHEILTHKDLLCLRRNRFDKPEDLEMASWAIPHQPFSLTSGAWLNEHQVHFMACGQYQQSQTYFTSNHTALVVEGVAIGTVSHVRGPYARYLTKIMSFDPITPQDMEIGVPPQDLNAQHFDCMNAILEIFEPSTAKKVEQLWKTLTMNLNQVDITDLKAPIAEEFDLMFRIAFMGAAIPETYKPELDSQPRVESYCESLLISITESLQMRTFLTMRDGLTGLGPLFTRRGDVVVALKGLDMCLVLRPRGRGYRIVGDAYVQNMMHGEAFQTDTENNVRDLREFSIL